MSTLVMDREVYCPLDEVFAFHSDLTRAPDYWAHLEECWRLDLGDGAPTVGTRFGWRYTMLGHGFTGEFIVRECEPGRRFVFEVRGGIRGVFTHEYRATAKTRTYVVVSVDYRIPLGVLGGAVNRLFVEHHNAVHGNLALDTMQSILEAKTHHTLSTQPRRHQCRPPRIEAAALAGQYWACPDTACARSWALVAADDGETTYWRPEQRPAVLPPRTAHGDSVFSVA